jgi:hypothetical protein
MLKKEPPVPVPTERWVRDGTIWVEVYRMPDGTLGTLTKTGRFTTAVVNALVMAQKAKKADALIGEDSDKSGCNENFYRAS